MHRGSLLLLFPLTELNISREVRLKSQQCGFLVPGDLRWIGVAVITESVLPWRLCPETESGEDCWRILEGSTTVALLRAPSCILSSHRLL